MDRYIYVLEDGLIESWEGKLPDDDIASAKDGYIIIIRVSDMKTMNLRGEWVDIEFLPFER